MTVGWCCVLLCAMSPSLALPATSAVVRVQSRKKAFCALDTVDVLSMIFVAPFSCFVRSIDSHCQCQFIFYVFYFDFFRTILSSRIHTVVWITAIVVMSRSMQSSFVVYSSVLCGKSFPTSVLAFPFKSIPLNGRRRSVAAWDKIISGWHCDTPSTPTSENSVLKNFILLPNKFFVHECACVCVLRFTKWNTKMCKECDGNLVVIYWLLCAMWCDDTQCRRRCRVSSLFIYIFIYFSLSVGEYGIRDSVRRTFDSTHTHSQSNGQYEWDGNGDSMSIRERTNFTNLIFEYAMRTISNDFPANKCART